jgi:tripartite-type tricarboxylate transporter receptor subunit TctC
LLPCLRFGKKHVAALSSHDDCGFIRKSVREDNMRLRSVIFALFSLLLPQLMEQAGAVDTRTSEKGYPSRSVMVISPAAGGATDAVARIVAAALTGSLNTPFIVEARPGAGGNIATEAVARAPADGYTLLLALNSMLTINPALYKNVRFNPIADFQPIGLVATTDYLLVANSHVQANTVKGLLEEAKARPNKISYSSSGYGTPSHLIVALLGADTGVEFQHVPYRTIANATTDLLSGQVDFLGGSMSGLLPLVRAGTLKGLGVTGKARSPLAPEIPTIAESVPEYEFEAWYALLAPAGTPPEIVDMLSSALSAALRNDEVRDRLRAQGADTTIGDVSNLKGRISDDLQKWSKTVAILGLRIN